MKFLALEREKTLAEVGRPTTGYDQGLLRAEARRAWELYQAGIVRELYFRADRRLAVLILECQDKDSARAALDSLPLVQARLIEFELIPLRPYPGFARLFSDPTGEDLKASGAG